MESTETKHVQPNYMAIFWWLAALTVIEVAVSIMTEGHLAEGARIFILVFLAAIKALLVALYFMHLRFERPSLGFIVATTLLLALIFVSANIGQWVLKY
jgi:cytochrome c oxidase subunit IV